MGSAAVCALKRCLTLRGAERTLLLVLLISRRLLRFKSVGGILRSVVRRQLRGSSRVPSTVSGGVVGLPLLVTPRPASFFLFAQAPRRQQLQRHRCRWLAVVRRL